MDTLTQLWYLIEHVGLKEKGYTVQSFCDEFFRIYYSDEAIELRNNLKNTELEKLAVAVSRYSPYSEDIEKYPNVYVSDSEIVKLVASVKSERMCP